MRLQRVGKEFQGTKMWQPNHIRTVVVRASAVFKTGLQHLNIPRLICPCQTCYKVFIAAVHSPPGRYFMADAVQRLSKYSSNSQVWTSGVGGGIRICGIPILIYVQ